MVMKAMIENALTSQAYQTQGLAEWQASLAEVVASRHRASVLSVQDCSAFSWVVWVASQKTETGPKKGQPGAAVVAEDMWLMLPLTSAVMCSRPDS